MAETLTIQEVVAGLQTASNADEIFTHARGLARALSSTPITQLVLEGLIAFKVVRAGATTVQTDEFYLARIRAGEVMEQARVYLGVGEPLVDLLQEEVSFVVDKAINGTGAPLEEEIDVSKRRVATEEFKIPCKVLRSANANVLRRNVQ